MAERVGAVAELWRYPVKSMRGERVDPAATGRSGIAGDRRWAIVDAESGKVASAKRPKLWLTLLECGAAYVEEPEPDGEAAPIAITLPDGREVRSDDPDRDRLLSEALGRAVRLGSCAPPGATYELSARDAEGLDADPDRLVESRVGMFAPKGTFFDTSTLHLVCTSSLEALARAHPDGRWDPRRFRPKVVVELDQPPDEGFAENGWAGRSLELGDEAQAVGLAPMPRCVMTTLPQGDLPRDPLVLRTLAEQNRQDIEGYGTYACVGLMANVSTPGRVAVGDALAVGDAVAVGAQP